MRITVQLDEAWDIFMEMRSLNVRPDLFTYNILINACVHKQDVPTALELMEIMRKDHITPDLVTYNSLVKVLLFDLYGGVGFHEVATLLTILYFAGHVSLWRTGFRVGHFEGDESSRVATRYINLQHPPCFCILSCKRPR